MNNGYSDVDNYLFESVLKIANRRMYLYLRREDRIMHWIQMCDHNDNMVWTLQKRIN